MRMFESNWKYVTTMVRCMQKVIPFLYVFAKEEDAINVKKMR